MRKSIILALLVSALAVPAVAQNGQGRGNGDHNRRDKSERPQNRAEARQNRAEVRADRAEVQQGRQEVRQDRAEVTQDRAQVRQNLNAGNNAQARRAWTETQRDRREVRVDRNEVRRDRNELQRDRGEQLRNQRVVATAGGAVEQRRDWRQNQRNGQRNWQDTRNVRNWADNRDWGHRDGDWNRNWRGDNRYDWRGYRNQHRDHYRVGRYYAPRGYSYSRWSIGYRLDPWFYGSSYWISDPWAYRLPTAYGPYRWVRYFDDVVLVDLYSGQIVDIIYDFFW